MMEITTLLMKINHSDRGITPNKRNNNKIAAKQLLPATILVLLNIRNNYYYHSLIPMSHSYL